MPNVVKVAMRWQYDATNPIVPGEWPNNPITDIVTTCHVQKLDSLPAPTLAERAAIAGAVLAWWQNDHAIQHKARENYPTGASLTAVEVQNVSPALSSKEVYDNLFPLGTSVQPNNLPLQCAFIVGLRTSLDARSTRGRIYWPPTATNSIDPAWNSGRVSVTQRGLLAKMTAHLARRIAELTSPVQVFALCVYSRVLDDSLAVTHYEVADTIATQRRRQFTPAGHSTFDDDGDPV